MLRPSYMSWVSALCRAPQHFLNDLMCSPGHWRVPNLSAGDQTTVDSLLQGLADEVLLDRAGLDQV
jgi:hypothetical protein